ncbi:MAG: TMEM175 family protein [Bacteroidota bacterium]
MSTQLHNELKKEFQLERMILFSDAVFAIAITLLVIEIKVPDVHGDVSDKILLKSLGHLIPKFMGFLISFILVGIYWVLHHRMFGFVTSYNRKLLILNLIFLFFIAFMPFSTGFYGEYSGPELITKQLKIPFTFYVLNFCCLGFMHHIMWRYITNPANKLAEPPVDALTVKLAKLRSLLVPTIFLLMLPVAYLTNVVVAIYIPMLIPVILRITNRRISRNYTKKSKINQ